MGLAGHETLETQALHNQTTYNKNSPSILNPTSPSPPHSCPPFTRGESGRYAWRCFVCGVGWQGVERAEGGRRRRRRRVGRFIVEA